MNWQFYSQSKQKWYNLHLKKYFINIIRLIGYKKLKKFLQKIWYSI